MTESSTRYQEARKITIIGSVVDSVLAFLKIVFGIIDNSQALVADGIHSLSDLATDIMVLLAMKHGSREADEEHPYGHGRIETIATVLLGLALIAVGAGIAQDAITRLFQPERLLNPGWFALGIAVLSVISKEAIYRYTMRAAKKLNSELLKANAWHSRTDAISSIVVIVGIAGSMAGLEYLDAIAAVGVAFLVAKIGWDLSWKSVRELIDTGVDAEYANKIREAINDVTGVQALHMLRTRRMGGDVLVDVHVIVDPKVSVSEGHQIGEKVRALLTGNFAEITDVTVHVDPEDDEANAPSSHLPDRGALLKSLGERWSGFEESGKIKDVTLHYLDGRMYIEVYLPLTLVTSVEKGREISARFSALAKSTEFPEDIKVHFTE